MADKESPAIPPEGEAPPKGEAPKGEAEKEAPKPFDPWAFENAVNAKFDALAARIQDLGKAPPVQAPTPKKTREEEDESWEQAFYMDPRGTMQRFKEETQREIYEQIQAERTEERAKGEFWNGFYSINPHLTEYDGIIRSILNANEERWLAEKINIGEAYKRLGAIAEGIGGKLAKAEEKKEPPEETIDGVPFIRGKAALESKDKPRTVADIVRARQAKFARR